ncbi:unnamed protein product, partial [Phaeothamnion confervicola]
AREEAAAAVRLAEVVAVIMARAAWETFYGLASACAALGEWAAAAAAAERCLAEAAVLATAEPERLWRAHGLMGRIYLSLAEAGASAVRSVIGMGDGVPDRDALVCRLDTVQQAN